MQRTAGRGPAKPAAPGGQTIRFDGESNPIPAAADANRWAAPSCSTKCWRVNDFPVIIYHSAWMERIIAL